MKLQRSTILFDKCKLNFIENPESKERMSEMLGRNKSRRVEIYSL